MYNKTVEDFFFHPKHVGSLDITHPLTTCFGTKHNGLTISLYVRHTENRMIERACYKTNGNPYVIASLEWLCRKIEGASLDALPELHYQQIIEALAMPTSKYPEAVQIERLFKELLKRIEL
jgi:nitrogen fixation NifU-like protein